MDRERKLDVRFVAHLPGLALAVDGNSVPVTGGHIRTFTADEWRELDDSYPFQRERIEAERPLFLEMTGEDQNEVVSEFENGTDRFTAHLIKLHRALTVVTAARLPDPRLSMRCLVVMGDQDGIGNSFTRALGDIGREMLIFGGGDSRVALSTDAINGTSHVLAWLARVHRHAD